MMKVLLVEDYPVLKRSMADFIRIVFGKEAIVFVTGSLIEAQLIFNGHNADLDFIVMDTHIEGGDNTFNFTREISTVYNRPIIATTTDEDSRTKMIRFGCTHACHKRDFFKFLENVLHPVIMANQTN